MKELICTAAGVMGAATAWLFGGWDAALMGLLICMAVDYISGSIVALVFHRSRKTVTGAYDSSYGLKGLCKKGLMLLFVTVAVQADRLLGSEYVRDAVCIGFCANEILSIVENLGLAGVPLPEAVVKGLQQLHDRK
ncbi:MAG: phage holin family protein [Ruminococcaceae bacterium]|nr:phage holin family protein [Oscillospiraceae bacterium]MBQ3215245.1 phage holin family protein [Oscillospiraceae bacterium]